MKTMSYETERYQLVNHLKSQGYIKHKSVEEAFLKTPREMFIPDNLKIHAYIDTPLEIGERQTISAPHMVAIMCEALDIKKGQTILEIGAGSGYHAAIISHLIGDTGHIYTIERFSLLAERAKDNLKSANITNVIVKIGDGSMGLKKNEPYDRIYVTCAAPKIPEPLINQLKDPGKLLIPVGQLYCDLKLINKKDSKITSENLGGCVFVPLVGKHGY